ncbi:MAG: hypothetical protein WB760_28125, partial [Xanthobacteraceae bacterium]
MSTITTGNQEEAADVSFPASGALQSGETYYIVVKTGSSVTILDSFVADSFTDVYSLTVSLSPNTTYTFNGVSSSNEIEIVDSCGNPVSDTINVIP